MKIRKEINSWSIREEIWSGALHTFRVIEENQKVGPLLDLLEQMYPDGIDMTELNDLLWFEPEYLYGLLGIEVDDE